MGLDRMVSGVGALLVVTILILQSASVEKKNEVVMGKDAQIDSLLEVRSRMRDTEYMSCQRRVNNQCILMHTQGQRKLEEQLHLLQGGHSPTSEDPSAMIQGESHAHSEPMQVPAYAEPTQVPANL